MVSAAELMHVYIDGARSGNPGPAGIGVVVLDAQGTVVATLSKYLGETTNNVAEYLALLYALQDAHARGFRRLAVRTDSELLAKQLAGEYKVRDGTLRLFYDLARHLMGAFEHCTVAHISRTQNTQADRLAGEAVESRFDTAVKIASGVRTAL